MMRRLVWLVILLSILPNILAIEATSSSCGSVNSDLTLSQDISVSGHCFVINASGITLNGAGFTITGDSSGDAINNTAGFDNITIRDFGGINVFNRGLRAQGMLGSLIFNNSINPSSSQFGLDIGFSNSTNVTSNTINTTAIAVLLTTAFRNVIDDNIITTTSEGIRFQSGSEGNILDSNTILTTGSNAYAAYVINSDHNVVTSNHLNTSGASSRGVFVQSSSSVNVSHNIVRTNGSTQAHGIQLQTATSSTLWNNTVNTFGGTEVHALNLVSSSNSNILFENTLSAFGQISYALQVSGSTTNTFFNNTFTTNQTNGAYSVFLTNGDNNDFTEDRMNATNFKDIFVLSTSTGNTFDNILLGSILDFSARSFSSITIDVNTTPSQDPADRINLSKYVTIDDQGSGSVSFNISYSNADIIGVDEDTIRMYNFDGVNWNILSTSSVDTENNIVSSGAVSSFSTFAPFGNATKPQAEPDQCGYVNDDLTITEDLTTTTTCFFINASNIVLDGGSFTIIGGENGTGVNISGFQNVTIQNFNIDNFTHAIEIASTENVTVQNNNLTSTAALGHAINMRTGSNRFHTLTSNVIVTNANTARGVRAFEMHNSEISFNNISTQASTGEGIFLQFSQNNTIQSNNITVSGGIQSISIASFSDFNALISNIIGDEGASSSSIAIASNYTDIVGNIITALKSKIGIQFTGASFSNVTDNTITTNGSSTTASPFDIREQSRFNNFSRNTLRATGTSGFGILFQNGASDNTFVDNDIIAEDANDIRLITGDNSNNRFINTTFDKNDISLGSADSDSILVMWYLDVIIRDAAGAAVQSANVSIVNATGERINLLTAADGSIPQQILVDFINNGTVITNGTPHEVNATFIAKVPVTTTINLFDANSTNITLILVNDTTAPTANITSPVNGSATTDSTPEIFFILIDNVLDRINFTLFVDGAEVANGTTSNGTSLSANISLSEGIHTIVIEARDEAGNSGNSSEHIISLDTTPPVILLPTPSGEVNASDVADVSVNVTDNTSVDTVTANITFPNSSTSVLTLNLVPSTNKYNASFTVPNLQGQYNVSYFANDSLNNINDTIIQTFTSSIADGDGDGTPDSEDTLEGNESSVTTSGVSDLNISISGNSTNGSFVGEQLVQFSDGGTSIMNFTHNFSSSDLDLSLVTITKASNSIVVNLSGQLQSGQTKTLVLTDNTFIGLCVKDAEIASESDISDACTGDNETIFTSCLGNSTGVTINGITCTDLGSTIRVENLSFSGVKGSQASTSSGGGGGGGSGGGYRAYTPLDITEDLDKAGAVNAILKRAYGTGFDPIHYSIGDITYVLDVRRISTSKIALLFGNDEYPLSSFSETSIDLDEDGTRDIAVKTVAVLTDQVTLQVRLRNKLPPAFIPELKSKEEPVPEVTAAAVVEPTIEEPDPESAEQDLLPPPKKRNKGMYFLFLMALGIILFAVEQHFVHRND